jgi:hypothetical protein
MVDMSGSGQPPALTITNPTGTFNTGDAVTFRVTVNSGGSMVSATAEPYEVITSLAGTDFAPATHFYGLIGQ